MEHEVFVPVPAETLRQVLRDPGRVARCVPGLQQDADRAAGPLTGRLKVRVGSHTITYRGALHLVEQEGSFVAEGDGAEARGSGSVKIVLTVRPEPTDGGTTLTFSGSSTADGRLAALGASARTTAAHRLLDRFAEALAVAASDGASASPEDASDDALDADASSEQPAEPDCAPPGAPSVLDGPVPPPSLGQDADDEFADLDAPAAGLDASDASAVSADDVDDVDDVDDLDDLDGLEELSELPAEPAAEAAHARRTMIGRSAEEVDHAPPRGRYAPTPGPDASGSGAALRWIAPAAALALASAVVVGRVLRRRK
ncbi:carbon monoxide dehydrogenase subunit G [Streptomyces sp. V4I23]|uniref:SRPBCC domain-containing protein n=1 Tax=Streptomyces sp. V4I23 TaxID=3042282 RepID=UPI00277FDBEA|nr:SRPBCC domain-containing protein [Streptomyces sp. V4I23]MDQ1009451.1 carbon monoxide dehydrogenase subunit G [Streptomyces sp. V4I23]